jgi:hypothetical protein
MQSEFMKLVMHTPRVIPDVLTKWHVQLLHILAAIPFISPTMLEF